MSRRGIKSKDYSAFSSAGDPTKQKSTNGADLHTTQLQLRAAEAAIRNPSVISNASKVSKQVINTLMAPAKSVAELLDSVSETVPQTAPVTEIFRALLRIELERQDNDKHIATLYHSMASMLVVLSKLDDVFIRESELTDLLNEKLDEIVNILNDFGNFCDIYYKHRTVVRFLRMNRYSEMLEDFTSNFASIKVDLEALISHNATLAVLQTSDTVNIIASDVSRLTRFMNTQTTRERETQEFIKAKGGVEAILKDNKLLDDVAAKLGDNVTKSAQANRALQHTLHASLEVQLKENQTLFTLKLQSVQDQIEETVNRSTKTILLKLDSGPHEVINDPDIRAIWKDMNWRNTVKSRHFVSAVHHHFKDVFVQYAVENQGAKHPDTWTLNYLSRVIFYPAIGDAIDEDSSGFVSLHELNQFFDARPEGWTTPQWLAYWAVGWYKDNLRYRDKIMARLGVFEESINGLHSDNQEALKEYLSTIQEDVKLIVNSLYNNVLDYFEDDSDEVVELDMLRDKYTELVTGRIEQQLAKSKHQLDDKLTLSIIVGVDTRLESKIMCLIHRLLKWHHKLFDIGKDKPLQEGVAVAMIRSIQVVFEAFTKRGRSLIESWRQQRMDVALQAEWYANGLFEDWYKWEKEQPDENEYDEEDLTDDEVEEGTEQDDDLVEYATRPPTATGTDAGSAVGEPEENEEQPDEEGDNQEQHEGADDEQSDKEEDGEEQDDDDGDQSRIANAQQVDERMQRLEKGMKELKDLMLRILERLDEQ